MPFRPNNVVYTRIPKIDGLLFEHVLNKSHIRKISEYDIVIEICWLELFALGVYTESFEV